MPEQQLFQEDLIFQEDFEDLDEALVTMAKRFLQADLVKKPYEEAIKKREKEYPTGIDLSVVGEGLPNIAIPHTQREYCKAAKVALVKLNKGISAGNMINPVEKLQNVRYLFMIINHEDSGQTSILSKIMELVTNVDNIRALEEAEDITSLYKVVEKYTL